MVFLPECADYIGENIEQSLSLAEPLNGDLVHRYRELAKRLKVWLSIGGFHEKVKHFLMSYVEYSPIILILAACHILYIVFNYSFSLSSNFRCANTFSG